MPGEMGSLLSQREEPYVVNRDPDTRTWRILDAWNPELREMGVEDEIEDSHPAVTVITEGAFVALIKEATILGIPGMNGDGPLSGDELEEFENLRDECDALRKQIDLLKEDKQNNPVNEVAGTRKLASQKLELLDKMANTNDSIDPEIIQLITKIGGNTDVK